AGITFTGGLQVAVLFTTSDHRLLRSGAVALLQPSAGLFALQTILHLSYREAAIGIALLIVFLGTTMYFLNLVDAPVRRTRGVSFSQMLRYYIDHLSRGTLAAEKIFDQIHGEIDALVGVAGFRAHGRLKCALVVPAVHPGPIGEIGGSNLPTKIIQT